MKGTSEHKNTIFQIKTTGYNLLLEEMGGYGLRPLEGAD
jgi:hypothetical protein